ncbi:MAG: hypothetical protein A3B31_02620 [Candidatus Komeilibacteria bacterium RIFCSPLOWO2_01_FULL_53_11]|uniref:Uncharacterized protein n=1 Tax=Candidatus Komeilibacteria bacterium RIFCSPLOWO2_01_FULL_53_11 TaxID=1798552 RepID=A0A1G2BNM0_9BACT|nr:MAG: hypothetical protein A3B31_02620 [Candidatus Komeilibacteria bacterium RIFCSPLOWO2_01_FULL_53_11]
MYYYEAYPTEKLARLREKRLKHNGNSIRELKKRLDLLADRKLGLPSTTFGYKSGAGFTLVEVIIYVGIVSFILVALLAVADIVQRGRTRFLISNVTQVTAARVLNTIDALVRNADGFVETSAGAPCVFANKLWLYFATSSQSYVPPGCLGGYSSGAVSVEPYSFTGATSTSPDSPRYAAEGYGFTTDAKYIYSAGSLNNGWHISKRYLADLSYDTGFGTDGAISTSGNFGARDIVQDGQYLYIVGGHEADSTTNQAKIEKRRITDGSLVTSFGTEGVITSTNAKIFKGIAIDSTYLYAVGYTYNSGTTDNDWLIEKRSLSTGALDTDFDTDGIIDDSFTDGMANDVTIDTANGYIYVVGDAAGSRTIEKRHTSTGAYVTAFNSTGYIQSGGGDSTSSGPNYPGTAADDSSVGSIAWSSVDNIKADDSSVAVAILTATNAESHYAKGTNFSFSIPTTATINGVVLEVEKKVGTCTVGTSISDNSVRLVKNGSVSGDDKQQGTAWPTSLTYATYGGAADLWGLSLTPADINLTNFGAVIQAMAVPAATCRANIDAMRITVYYTTSGGTYNSVTMDATATTTDSVTLGSDDDSHMKKLLPTNNYGSAITMLAGKVGITDNAFTRPLVKLDLSSIPTNATVNSASMTLTLTASQATSEVVNAYALRASWGETTSSWTNRDTGTSWVTGGADDTTSDRSASSMGSVTVASGAGGTQYTWALDAATVESWVSDPSSNYGMVLIGNEGANSTLKTFATQNNATASYRPSLAVSYTTSPPTVYVYVTGDDGSDLIVSKVNTSDGTLDSGFGSSGTATADSATTAGYGINVRDDYLYVAGHSSNDWYIEKRSRLDGGLASGFPMTGASATDIPYGGLRTDEDYLYILGATVISGTRYQYVEKRFPGGTYAEHNGVRLWCYQDYPNRGLSSSCTVDPPHSDVARMDLTDPLQLFVGLTDLSFTTTTAASRDGVETLLNLRYMGDIGSFGIATVTASSTASFRIDP